MSSTKIKAAKRGKPNYKRGQKYSKEPFRRSVWSPPYTTKADRDELGKLSLVVFGSKNKWQKLASNNGLSVDGIKTQMVAMYRYLQGVISESKEVRPTETKNEPSTDNSTEGSSQGDDVRGPEVRGPQLETRDELVEADGRESETQD